MAIDRKRLETKLAATRAKDVKAITAEQVYIPFLERPYTEEDLSGWLQKRIDVLEEIAANDSVTATRERLHSGLDRKGQEMVTKLEAKEPGVYFPKDLTAENYDKLVGIILADFVSV